MLCLKSAAFSNIEKSWVAAPFRDPMSRRPERSQQFPHYWLPIYRSVLLARSTSSNAMHTMYTDCPVSCNHRSEIMFMSPVAIRSGSGLGLATVCLLGRHHPRRKTLAAGVGIPSVTCASQYLPFFFFSSHCTPSQPQPQLHPHCDARRPIQNNKPQ